MQTWSLPRLAVLAFVLASPAAAEGERRQLGAHQHGHGALNIAIEGSRVALELEVPGMDIVGFEYEPNSDGDRIAVAAAIARLEKPLELFAPPAEADCKVIAAEVAHEMEGTHSAFHATYTLDCAAIARLTKLSLGYFKAFPGAAELDVSAASANGQIGVAVTSGKPELDLSGVM